MDAKQRLSSLHDAREIFFKALKTHEHEIYKLGYEDGFSAGWDAALQRLAELRPQAAFSPAGGGDVSTLLQGDEETPAQETLLTIISKTPGLQRQEIVDMARKTLSSLSERTVRTALQRMKNAGELHVADSKWYVSRRKKPAMGAGDASA